VFGLPGKGAGSPTSASPIVRRARQVACWRLITPTSGTKCNGCLSRP